MGPRGRPKRGTEFGAATAVALVLAICVSVGSSNATNAPVPTACTWGASSIAATFEDGHVTMSTPNRSGCTPDSLAGP